MRLCCSFQLRVAGAVRRTGPDGVVRVPVARLSHSVHVGGRLRQRHRRLRDRGDRGRAEPRKQTRLVTQFSCKSAIIITILYYHCSYTYFSLQALSVYRNLLSVIFFIYIYIYLLVVYCYVKCV